MKQSGRMWNETLHLQMTNWKFHQLECEYCIYYCKVIGEIIIIAIHVDDFFMVGNSRDTLTHFGHQLQSVWQISDAGDAHFCMGIALSRNRECHTVSLSQTTVIDHIITQFSLLDAHPITIPMDPGLHLSRPTTAPTPAEQLSLSHLPYHSLVRSLMYIHCSGYLTRHCIVCSPTTLSLS